jgi:site-specific DNA-methyltransferase (adenine-specific)
VEAQGEIMSRPFNDINEENIWNSDNSGYKKRGNPNCVSDQLGRFPANLIHDNSEEVRECFPETKTGGVGKGRDSKGKFYGGGFHNPETYNGGDSGNASRFFKSIKKPYVYSGKEYEVDGFVKKCKPQAPSNYNDEGSPAKYFKSIIYQAKASKSERNKGMDSLEAKPMYKGDGSAQSLEIFGSTDGGRENRKNNHPTVKPVALMEYLIKMITPKGGIVLEPFAGSGSTLVAAKENGFNFIGIELTEDYIPIIEARTGVKAEKIQPIENVIQKTQTEPTSVIKEKPINTQKPKNDIDTCECGGRIVKTSSGSKICDNCFRTF